MDEKEHSLHHMSANYDAVLKQMGENDEKIKQLEKRATHLENTEPTAEVDRLK